MDGVRRTTQWAPTRGFETSSRGTELIRVRACKLLKRTEPRNIRDKARPFGRVFLNSSAWIAPTFCWHSCHEHWTILIFLSSETKNRTELDFKEKRRDYYE